MRGHRTSQLFGLLFAIILSSCQGWQRSYVDPYGVEMVLVPAGEFVMGADPDQFVTRSHAFPLQVVYVDDFYIDKYEVSISAYQQCVNADVCRPIEFTDRMRLLFPEQERFGDYPMTFMTWDDAKTYCEWRGARLPTEAEWEKAARGTDGRIYPWGNEIDCSYANYGIFAHPPCTDGTLRPVGSYPKGVSPYGAYDMAGNASEWVSGYEQPAEEQAGSQCKVARGGGAFSSDSGIRVFERSDGTGGDADPWSGVRCAKTP